MLDTDTKRRIDTSRDILVGKVPDPKSQVEQITIALIYKFMDDIDAESEEWGGDREFFSLQHYLQTFFDRQSSQFVGIGMAKVTDHVVAVATVCLRAPSLPSPPCPTPLTDFTKGTFAELAIVAGRRRYALAIGAPHHRRDISFTLTASGF